MEALNSQGSDLCEEELQNLEECAKPQSTKRSTEYGVKKFTEWLEKRQIKVDYNIIKPDELNDILRKFYAEVKSNSGNSLTPSSLTCICAVIHRFVTGAPFNRTLNIIEDREFTSPARCKLYIKCGNKKPEHKKSY